MADFEERHRWSPPRSEPSRVYAIIAEEGRTELLRPTVSIVWSALAAGLAISFSMIAEAALRAYLPDAPWRPTVENFGYVVGFLIVIQSRLQLFTENTITAVLPMLKDPCRRTILGTTKLWGLSLLFNVVGAGIAALVILHGRVVPPEILEAALSIGAHVAELSAQESFARAIPAGFLIAALVWMLPSSEGSEVAVITIMIYMIALGDFTHVIVGTVELFLVVFAGEHDALQMAVFRWLPTLLGNIIGGTFLFALLAYGQVQQELEEEEAGERGPNELRDDEKSKEA
ncbi:formate/nitrite transporter family protein [Parvularcula lutaonensis]|uniref:Formate/nitrite transporter family protein n=1 Tax=Parvularcula lutaonensis TaxID=491923 RepID=A0ABV7M8C6_9PROT|nr:formate/nitrite transporter family protein [Parvularcula lutaonensis]GGY57037.1 membrane protein [Parvularcula lutaonensis]